MDDFNKESLTPEEQKTVSQEKAETNQEEKNSNTPENANIKTPNTATRIPVSNINYSQSYESHITETRSDNQQKSSQPGYASPVYQAPGYSYNPQNNNRPPVNQTAYNPNYNNMQPPYPPANQPKKKKGLKIALSIIAVIVAVAIVVSFISFFNPDNNSDTNEPVTGDGTIITNEATPDTPAPTGEILSSVEVAEIGRASCVGVLVYSSNSLFQSSEAEAGEGTGIVAKVSKDGKSTYILTCAHVISDSDVTVKILLEDGTTYDATIIGFDQQTDVGVLRVRTTDLTCATFGDFSKLKVGSPIYAVGNPGGAEFFGSVTNGIVSAISRSINNEIGYTMDCIQHNAAINPGNSGGALLNEYGQVIGINSSKIASTEYEGMSFAVPISTALDVANKLIEKGYVPDRPKLGITYSLASSHQTYAMAVQMKGLPAGSLVIRQISVDSDLNNSDVQIGDMIIAVNGKNLDTPDVLLDIIDKASVDDELKLKICRLNTDYSIEEFEVTAKLVEDKGSTATTPEEPTTDMNRFDYFNQFGN